jgi:hypothetical protein
MKHESLFAQYAELARRGLKPGARPGMVRGMTPAALLALLLAGAPLTFSPRALAGFSSFSSLSSVQATIDAESSFDLNQILSDMASVPRSLDPPVQLCNADPALPTPPLPPIRQVTHPTPVAHAAPVTRTAPTRPPSSAASSSQESPRIQALLAAAGRDEHTATHYECYHFVKEALYKSGMVRPGSLPGGAAKDAVSDLSKQGFTNLLDDPKNAYFRNSPDSVPVGAVVVYAGDTYTYRYGDVQIHEPHGWVSDYHSANAMIHQWNGNHFHVIGVMVKPGA